MFKVRTQCPAGFSKRVAGLGSLAGGFFTDGHCASGVPFRKEIGQLGLIRIPGAGDDSGEFGQQQLLLHGRQLPDLFFNLFQRVHEGM